MDENFMKRDSDTVALAVAQGNEILGLDRFNNLLKESFFDTLCFLEDSEAFVVGILEIGGHVVGGTGRDD